MSLSIWVQSAFQFLCLLFINDTTNTRTLHHRYNLEVKHAETILKIVCLHQIECFFHWKADAVTNPDLQYPKKGRMKKLRRKKKKKKLCVQEKMVWRKFSQAAKSSTWTAVVIFGKMHMSSQNSLSLSYSPDSNSYANQKFIRTSWVV